MQVVQLDSVGEHPNADRLELVQIGGWQVVVQKGAYVAGQEVVYVPIDSVLSQPLEGFLFPPDSKITLSRSRVRSIKIRQALSQGMVVDHRDASLQALFPALAKARPGDDVAGVLGVTKHEPPEPGYQRGYGVRKGSWKNHPLFVKYTDIEAWKHYPQLFGEDELISVTEKLHGTSARYGRYPRNTNHRLGFLTRLLVRLGLRSRTEFVYGSRNVQLQTGGQVYYDRNVYAEVAKRYRLAEVLPEGTALYGEIVGTGIQKGYDYGFTEGHGFFAYDVRVGGEYLSPVEFQTWCLIRGIPMVPLLYEGPKMGVNLDVLQHGPSVLNAEAQSVREGVVIKPAVEQRCHMGRKVVKHINDEYLLKEQSDYH